MLPSASLKALKASYFQCSWRRDSYQIYFFSTSVTGSKSILTAAEADVIPGKLVQRPCGNSARRTSNWDWNLPRSWWTQLCRDRPDRKKKKIPLFIITVGRNNNNMIKCKCLKTYGPTPRSSSEEGRALLLFSPGTLQHCLWTRQTWNDEPDRRDFLGNLLNS